MDLRPVRKTSASAECFEQLAARLMNGDLPPGDPLPAERTLTETFGVNRQAIREALKRLAQAGLVRISQGEPTRVLDYRRHGTLDLLERLLVDADGTLRPEAIRSVMEMRLSIGTDAARLAAVRATPSHLESLESYEDAARAAGDERSLAAIDLALWETVVDAADNIAYRLAFNSLRNAYEPLTQQVAPVIAEEIGDIDAHVELIDAIAGRRDEDARVIAHRLLSKGAASVALFLSES